MKSNDIFSVIGVVLSFLFIVVVMAILYAWPVQLLWNWIMVSIFSLPKITFTQALGLRILTQLLFATTNTVKKEK